MNKTFDLMLNDATHTEVITDVISFTGMDASGSFGILAGHARMMTSLVTGLARYRTMDGIQHYLAVPGGILYFHDGNLHLSTHRYLKDDNYLSISSALREKLLNEEENLHSIKQSLHRMEEQLMKCMWEMTRKGI